jgi:predicted Na+-dependent transporter
LAKKTKRGKRKFTIPLAVVGGLAAGLAYPAALAVDGQYEAALKEVTFAYTGYHVDQQKWSVEGLTRGLLPLAIGLAVHKFVGGWPLNANRALAAAGVPFIRI